MVAKYKISEKNQPLRLSNHDLSNMVYKMSSNYEFVAQPSIVNAITDILVILHNSYDEYSGNETNTIGQVLQVIRTNPIPACDMDTSKSGLAGKPLIVQLLMLMQNMCKHGGDHVNKKVLWLGIAMHTGVLLHHNKKTSANNILMQFKLAIFFTTKNRTWIWRQLPDYSSTVNSNDRLSVKSILVVFINIMKRTEQAINTVANHAAFDSVETSKDQYLLERQSQIRKILIAYERAHYLNVRKKIKSKSNQKDNVKEFSDKPFILSNELSSFGPTNEPSPYYWDTPKEDVEQYSNNYDVDYLGIETETHEGLTPSFEEVLDSYDSAYINYEQIPNAFIRHSASLQTIDLTLQQNYISQRELALNSNTRLLSVAGYQILFTALVRDAQKDQIKFDKQAASAGILLLSMLTALPVESLITKGYIKNSRIFRIGDSRAYIQHRLGITQRLDMFDDKKYENKLDVIKIPVPLWLIQKLIDNNLPSKTDITIYLKSLRKNCAFPYLSIARIESALHVVLSRYTPNCYSHIANIICRIPAPQAPAMYYSSHSSEELIAHYKTALSVLNADGEYDLFYVTPWHKYTTGSGFALKIEYVRNFMETLRQWVRASSTEEIHFDRVSIYTWFVFCLLTGVRPNNGIGKISDIDLNMGWLLIDDKPSKSARNHRLIPLCFTLIRHLRKYQRYLIDYQLGHPLNLDISEAIDQITSGDEVSLLILLSKHRDKITLIKRGAVYEMTKELIDLNPYWTRHFVRTQLERKGADIALINGVIGHEKNRQEALGKFSSLSKEQIKSVGKSFEEIARQLGLSDDAMLPNCSAQGFSYDK